MAKWIVAEKAKAGVRHAGVCPNVTGRIKKRIAQSKRDRAGPLALVDYSHKWRELVFSGRLVRRCHDVFLWCYLCFVLLRFRRSGGPSFNRPSICRRPDSHTCFFSLLYLEMSLFPSIFLGHFRFVVWRLEYIVHSSLPNGVFLPSDHGLDF